MKKPVDPEQYARVVLWHLCTIQAALDLIHADAIQQSGLAAGASSAEILDETSKRGRQIRRRAEPLYHHALELANLSKSPDFPFPAKP